MSESLKSQIHEQVVSADVVTEKIKTKDFAPILKKAITTIVGEHDAEVIVESWKSGVKPGMSFESQQKHWKDRLACEDSDDARNLRREAWQMIALYVRTFIQGNSFTPNLWEFLKNWKAQDYGKFKHDCDAFHRGRLGMGDHANLKDYVIHKASKACQRAEWVFKATDFGAWYASLDDAQKPKCRTQEEMDEDRGYRKPERYGCEDDEDEPRPSFDNLEEKRANALQQKDALLDEEARLLFERAKAANLPGSYDMMLDVMRKRLSLEGYRAMIEQAERGEDVGVKMPA